MFDDPSASDFVCYPHLGKKKQKPTTRERAIGVTGRNTQSLFAKDEHSLGSARKLLFI